MSDTVRVQKEDFDAGAELSRLRLGRPSVGAVASFVGTVRDVNEGSGVFELFLEHYPGMTEQALLDIAAQARSRWKVIDTVILHRIGLLQPTDQIVLVMVSSAHRGDAFEACQFIMDYLKTRAPFWKRERTPDGTRWVEARESDDTAAARWVEERESDDTAAARTNGALAKHRPCLCPLSSMQQRFSAWRGARPSVPGCAGGSRYCLIPARVSFHWARLLPICWVGSSRVLRSRGSPAIPSCRLSGDSFWSPVFWEP